ncbi:MAG: hypothetical protein IBX72_03000 [Nitrospirae bacterium]|jgi:hypothetical protein|nr:hypothetical protein [Nitrospirota bacterium]
MDKSSQYIKMSESAKVIQKQWKPEFGDFFVSMSLGLTSPCQSIVSDLEKKVSYLKTIKAVWLPRQDQLQEMLIEKYATFWDLAIAFSNALMGDNASYFEKFDSMEKLWFAFIMLEKYKKKWKEGEWV